jgi:tricorn protease
MIHILHSELSPWSSLVRLNRSLSVAVSLLAFASLSASAASKPHIFQHPALSHDLIAFGYAGDLWTVPRDGGRAIRLTTGVGIETAPVFSPDGSTIAFAGEYDGNTDVFTIPATGGIPHRVTYHPATDVPVGWSPDGKRILFRSTRDASSRYTQLYTVPAAGGIATLLPLPMAYDGQYSADGSAIVYSPLPPAFGFSYSSFTSWGNYHGGQAGFLRITTLPGLDSTEIPHEIASDFSPVYVGKDVYFLSQRTKGGHIAIFRYDAASKAVSEAFANSGPQIRSLSGDGATLIYDQLGEIHLFDTASKKEHLVPIEIDADLPEVRATIKNVAAEIDHIGISPTGVRAVVEAHGEILTVAAKHGPTRNLTNTTTAMERSPAWSPDGQSIAYFSDESGLYALHVAPQTGGAVKKFPLAPEPAYYFSPKWSPDSKKLVFHDNRLHLYLLDTTNGKLTVIGENNTFGGFSDLTYDMAWSPDSKWIAYPRSMPNHLHSLYLYSVDTGQSTQVTTQMADSRFPAFDREGKFLYFAASTNYGATSDGLDMTSDLYDVNGRIYAAVLSSTQASPVAPELEDEKAPGAGKSKDASDEPTKDADKPADAKPGDDKAAHKPPPPPKPVKIDLAGIESRIVAIPLPAGVYTDLQTGLKGSVYFLERPRSGRFGERESVLNRWTIEDRKTERLAERVESFQLSADGEKMLLELSSRNPAMPAGPGPGGPPTRVIVPANAPIKPGDGTLSFADLQVHVDPHAEWAQMYHEVWRIERAYFYDAHFHGTDITADEKRLEPYVHSIASRADLNYIFQEMLSAFSVGHLRGNGGVIPEAKHLPGGLLGADYAIKNNRYCFAKIYTGGDFNPDLKAPLTQPGLNVAVGDCILSINGEDLTTATDIQQPLEGTAGHTILLHIAAADGSNPRDINVVPLGNEAQLRNTDWIESNQRKVDQLSGGKLAYVYLPDTAAGGFTNFNRYFMAQTDKQGAVIDERFNGGGQIADYIIEVLGRKIESYWSPRYGTIEHTPNAGIYGPKVMIINEFAGSGGDAMPWLFRHNNLGPLVGKRTWGGLVGIGEIPVLMDGGHVTSPSVAFFSPKGEWDVENHGVEPDIRVDQDPKAVSEGHDPQLEKAVAVALQQLAEHPNPQPQRPAYPNYH